ncbi:hypothetical protein E4U41_003216, partial [Claviceps citrina]
YAIDGDAPAWQEAEKQVSKAAKDGRASAVVVGVRSKQKRKAGQTGQTAAEVRPSGRSTTSSHQVVLAMDLKDLDGSSEKLNMDQNQNQKPNQAGTTVGILSTDPIEALTRKIATVMAENAGLKQKVWNLEEKVHGILSMINVERDRASINTPYKGYFGINPPLTQDNNNNKLGGWTRANRSSGLGTEDTVTTSACNQSMGYTNKKSVWGTALASMLIGMVRYYVTKTGTKNVVMDETQIMKCCI